MSMTQNKFTSSIGFEGLLTILFIALKLTGYIAWSWWWVLSPLLFTFSVAVFCLILIALIAMFLK